MAASWLSYNAMEKSVSYPHEVWIYTDGQQQCPVNKMGDLPAQWVMTCFFTPLQCMSLDKERVDHELIICKWRSLSSSLLNLTYFSPFLYLV